MFQTSDMPSYKNLENVEVDNSPHKKSAYCSCSGMEAVVTVTATCSACLGDTTVPVTVGWWHRYDTER